MPRITSIESVIGDDTQITVHFDYQPAEKQVLHPNDQAYPGCDAEATVTSVVLKGDDIIDSLNQATLNRLAEECLERVHLYDEDDPND